MLIQRLFFYEFGTADVVGGAVDVKFSGGSYVFKDNFTAAVEL